jgi:hypothetical protein
MNQLRWFLRAKRMAQNPPSLRRVIGLGVLIAVLVMIALAERSGFLPEWFAAQPMR